MKTIQLFTGGHKLHNNDFEYLRDGIEDVLYSVVKEFQAGKPSVILKGKVTAFGPGSNRRWLNPLLVFFQDNFYSVAAQTTGIDPEAISFDIVNVPDGLNPVTYRDGSERNVHIDKTLVLRNDTLGDIIGTDIINIDYNFEKTLEDTVANFSFATKLSTTGNLLLALSNANLKNYIARDGWTAIALNAQWTALEAPQYRILDADAAGGTGKKIELRGKIRTTISEVSPTNVTVFDTLISTIRPTNQVRIPLMRSGSGTLTGRLVEFNIAAAGTSAGIFYQPDGTTQDITLDNVSWWVR